jgi:hypothetical protein
VLLTDSLGLSPVERTDGKALFDVELRDAMVENAEQLYLARYQWSEIRTQIQELARSVAGAARTRAGEPGAS